MLTPRRTALAAALALAGAAGVAFLPAPQPATAAAAPAAAAAEVRKYTVDPVHSAVVFSVLYQGMSPFYGQFNDSRGTVEYNGQDAQGFKLTFEVPMDSIDTHNGQRDNHLKQPDWFNAREYPTVKFVSDSLEKDGDAYTLKGKLTLHGVTKDIEATVTHLKAMSTSRGDRMGLGATFTVKRSDFGVTTMVGEAGISDEITLHVGVQATPAE